MEYSLTDRAEPLSQLPLTALLERRAFKRVHVNVSKSLYIASPFKERWHGVSRDGEVIHTPHFTLHTNH
jgi:hypothetical protein